jgi:hypothetical protein
MLDTVFSFEDNFDFETLVKWKLKWFWILISHTCIAYQSIAAKGVPPIISEEENGLLFTS